MNTIFKNKIIILLNAELIPICHLLALLGAHHILHVSRVRVNYNVHTMHSATFSIVRLFSNL
jgi:hypothetical protein